MALLMPLLVGALSALLIRELSAQAPHAELPRYERQEQPFALEGSLGAYEIRLHNTSGSELVFTLRSQASTWKRFTLAGNTRRIYQHADFIAIRTYNTVVEYRLTPRREYTLAWNTARGVWDVYTIPRP